MTDKKEIKERELENVIGGVRADLKNAAFYATNKVSEKSEVLQDSVILDSNSVIENLDLDCVILDKNPNLRSNSSPKTLQEYINNKKKKYDK